MRTLLVGALSAALVSCNSPVPPRGTAERCTSQGCFARTVAATQLQSKRTQFRPKSTIAVAKSKKVAAKATAAAPQKEAVEEKVKSAVIIESDFAPSAQPSLAPDRGLDKATTGIAGKTEISESGQPVELSDPVLEKAKVAVAVKMENPASAEFVDIRPATRPPFEIICGHVKGKRKSGEATGERPFLYLVKEDEAYIVDRRPDSMAAIMYRAQCTSPH